MGVGVGASRFRPIPTVACKNAGSVGGLIAFENHFPHFLRGVEHHELIVEALKVVVCGLSDFQDVVEPSEVAIGAVASKLGVEALFVYRGFINGSPTLYFVNATDVFYGYALAFVDEEYA